MLSTKAVFALEKLWMLGTPLLPSMLTIILSRFQISIAFFLNNSHLFHTFALLLFFSLFLSRLFCIYFNILHSMFYPGVEGCRSTAESSFSFFFNCFQPANVFIVILNMSHPGCASIFNYIANTSVLFYIMQRNILHILNYK